MIQVRHAILELHVRRTHVQKQCIIVSSLMWRLRAATFSLSDTTDHRLNALFCCS